MARRQLKTDIERLDRQLLHQRQQLQRNGKERAARLRKVSPLWLLGGGFAAGLLAGRVTAISTKGACGVGLGSLRVWSLARNILPVVLAAGAGGRV